MYKEIYGEETVNPKGGTTSPRTTSMGDNDQLDQELICGEKEKEEVIFGFPILNTTSNVPMKSIPLSVLPSFHGVNTKDPDSLLFEFNVHCRSYNYNHDGQKLKLFPTTLKDSVLRWFMGQPNDSISTWDAMKHTFLKKYHDYSRNRHTKEDIFNMQQREEESLEDYVERFLCNL